MSFTTKLVAGLTAGLLGAMTLTTAAAPAQAALPPQPLPTITPNSGPAAGGTAVTIDAPQLQFTQVTCGDYHCLGLTNDGVVMAWGKNSEGQLGDGTTSDRTVPTAVQGLTDIVGLAAGISHSAALKADGTVFTWGSDRFDTLGDGSGKNRLRPAQVPGLVGVAEIAAGQGYTAGRKDDGTVVSWGSLEGLGSTTPKPIAGLEDIVKIHAGGLFLLGERADGAVVSVGGPWCAGVPVISDWVGGRPRVVPGLTRAVQFATGNVHSLALTADGNVLAWGRSAHGQIGTGDFEDHLSGPELVPGLTDVAWVAVADSKSFAMTKSGQLYGWGSNSFGQLGDNETEDQPSPVPLSGWGDVVSIGGSWYPTIAIRSDGTLVAAGRNTEGQLGDGTTSQRTTPVRSGVRKVAGVLFDGAPGTALSQSAGAFVTVKTPRHPIGPADVKIVSEYGDGTDGPDVIVPRGYTYVAGSADAASSTFSVSAGARTADGADTHTLTVVANDTEGNRVKGAVVGFSADTGVALSSPTATTDANGVAEVTATSVAPKTYAVRATIGGTAVNGSPASVTFVAGPGDATTSALTVSTGTRTADGTDAHTLSVLVKDAQGNLVKDAMVGFTAPVGTTLSADTARSDPSGVARVTLTTTTAASYSVGATIGGVPVVSSPQSVAFVAGAPDAAMSRLTVSGGAQLADGVAAHTATATVRDAFGNLVKGATVGFGAPAGAKLSAASATSGDDGTAAVTVTSTAPGQYGIHALLGTADIKRSPGTVAFAAGIPSAALSTFSVSSGAKIADGKDAHTLTAVIKDAQGNLLPNVPVDFAAAGASLSAASALSDASGVARVTVTSTKARTYAASAALSAAITGSPKDIAFAAGAASAAESTISASPTSIPADGVTATIITVTLKDANGNPLTAGGDRVGLSTTAGTLSTVTDNGDGTYTATLTGTDPATATVSFTVGSTAAPATVRVTLEEVSRYADPAASTLTVTPGAKIADGTDAHTLTATVRDSSGRPLTGVAVTFATAPDATLSAKTDISDATGVASVTVTSTKAGRYQVAAAIAGTSISGSPQDVVFAAGPASLKESTISASPATIPADGTTASTVTVTAKDAHGNPLTAGGADVRLATTAGTLSAVRDNGDGTYTATLTGTDPAKATLSFSLGGSSAAATETVTLTEVDGVPDATASQFTVTAGTRTADGTAAHTLTATVKDANGKPVKGARVTFTAAKGATLSAGSDTSDASGVASVAVTSTTAGTYAVTASLSGTAINGSPKQVVFAAGALSLADSTITASPTIIPADGTTPSTITVTLKDADGNALVGGGADLKLSSTAGTVSPITDNGDGTYTATLTGTTPGTADLSFAVGGATAPSRVRVQLTEVTGVPDAASTRFGVSQGAKLADGKDAHTLSAIVKDAKGTPVKGAKVTFTAEPGVTLSAASDLSDEAGVASVTAHSTRAGTYQVGAHLSGTTVTGAPQAVVFIAGAASADATTITAAPSTIRADGKTVSTIAVRLVDQHGNALTIGGDTVLIASTAGTVSTVKDNGDGTYAATLSGTKPATATISATVNGAKAPATATVVLLDAGIEVSRVAGPDRFGTSIEVSRTEFPGTAPVVFLASGENFPDALSAGPAAAKAGGPVLLTAAAFLPAAVKDEIARLKPQRIVLAGGTAAVSASVEAEVGSFRGSATVVREKWGGDRYGTSRAIAAAEFTTASRVYVATGMDFPDALSAGAAAGSKDAPVLLVPGPRSAVDADTAATLRALRPAAISVVGGPAVVSTAMAGSLAQYGAVSRLAGSDRFGTASVVNRDAFRTADTAMIASGLNFPDALSAAPWAARTASPLYLARPDCVPKEVLTDLEQLGVTHVYLIGGTAVLTARLETLTSCG